MFCTEKRKWLLGWWCWDKIGKVENREYSKIKIITIKV